MDKGKMRYELKLRQNSGANYSRQSVSVSDRNKRKDKLMNKSIASVVILICVMLLKMSSSDYAKDILSSIKTLVSKQVDYKTIGESALSAFNSFLDDIEAGKDSSFASANKFELVPPLEEGKIIKEFEENGDFTLSSQGEANGITIKASPGAFVRNSVDGVVTGKTQNPDGSFRVTVLGENDVSVVYDGLEVCYFNANDSVLASQLLGAIKQSEDAGLVFCVYVKSEAQNPKNYLGEIYN